MNIARFQREVRGRTVDRLKQRLRMLQEQLQFASSMPETVWMDTVRAIAVQLRVAADHLERVHGHQRSEDADAGGGEGAGPSDDAVLP